MKPLSFVALCLTLALTVSCAKKQGLLIPLENDLPDRTFTKEYHQMLNLTRWYDFTLAPEVAPKGDMADWTDEDYAALAAKTGDRDAVVVTFGRVVQGKGYIGFLAPDCTRKTDARFEWFLIQTFSYYGRNQTIDYIIRDYLRDKHAR